MERRRVLLVGFLACLLTLSTILAGAPAPASSISVGDFAVLVAAKLDAENSQAALTPDSAAEILKKHGVKMTADLSSSLTEKDAVGLFGQLGIVLQTEHPESLLSRERAASLVGIFSSNLASTGDRTGSTFNARAEGTGASTPSIETTPLDCQSLPRPPAPCSGPQSVCNPCMDCCKNSLGLTGKTCGKLCQKKNLVVSPGEPTP
ncbi:MAG TPA: hypothetical protein VGR38_05015 [Candidatus Polarisedimenticolia bacterium]|nr:hypothetical protein [Candidatus Polarisedimenticolia bacterium]